MKLNANASNLCLVLLVGSVLLTGCSQPQPSCPVPGNPEAVLAGTWSLTTDTPSTLPPTTLSFDSTGTLTNIAFNVGGIVINQAPLSGCVQVKGTSVSISQNLSSTTNLSFVGTLNSDFTRINGNLITTLNLNGNNIVITGVPATMVKQ